MKKVKSNLNIRATDSRFVPSSLWDTATVRVSRSRDYPRLEIRNSALRKPIDLCICLSFQQSPWLLDRWVQKSKQQLFLNSLLSAWYRLQNLWTGSVDKSSFNGVQKPVLTFRSQSLKCELCFKKKLALRLRWIIPWWVRNHFMHHWSLSKSSDHSGLGITT